VGRAIVKALLKGDQTPEQITGTAGRRLRATKPDIARAVDGVLSDSCSSRRSSQTFTDAAAS